MGLGFVCGCVASIGFGWGIVQTKPFCQTDLPADRYSTETQPATDSFINDIRVKSLIILSLFPALTRKI